MFMYFFHLLDFFFNKILFYIILYFFAFFAFYLFFLFYSIFKYSICSWDTGEHQFKVGENYAIKQV